jgi:hypothetical protein
MIFSLEMHYVLKEGNAEMAKLGIFQKMGKSKFWQKTKFCETVKKATFVVLF